MRSTRRCPGHTPSGSPDTPTVFVVDGDASVREALEVVIRSAGWQPRTAASAEEFLARPRVLTPSCLMVELRLLALTGLELQRLIAERTEMPVIFMSEHIAVPSAIQAMKAGAIEVLTKPLVTDSLLPAIRCAIERSRAALDRLALGITEFTVKVHRGRMMRKMRASSFAELVTNTGIPPDRDLVRLSNQGLDRRRLTRVTEYITANLERDLTIAQLAKVAFLSRFHFARAFKAAMGQSPHQYVSVQRLERAKELLVRGEESLLDIAIALNFSSQANFTRAFRTGTGTTPGKYRRSFMHSEALPGRICAAA